ncbi:MAG TPA: type VII secretion protein EssC [Symbiobacteriaceae bacterium]|nr:type VII secretion protein EssC [Symbiobacteriaceae bacterium]
MSDAPIFQRSPRIPAALPEGEVEIPAPPPAPAEPSMSATSIIFSMVPGLLGALVIYFFARANGGSMMIMLFSLPMMAAGYLVNIGQFWLQKRKYHADVERREQKYRAVLQQHREQLQRARDQQRSAMRETDPDPSRCTARAASLDAHLWERSPRDADFLRLRLGLGKVAAGVTVKVPRPANTLDADPLHQEAQSVAAEYSEVPGVPVGLPLREIGAAGVVGSRQAVLSMARCLAMQIATHHSPYEVKIAAVFPAGEAEEWAWLRWLPHTWSDDRQKRYLASDREGADRLLDDLYDLMNRRRSQLQAQMGSKAPPPSPAFVIFMADPGLIENEPVVPLVLREGMALGAYALIIADRKEDLPMECRGIAQVGPGVSQLIQTAPSRCHVDFLPDEAGCELGEQFSRALAPVRLQRMSAAGEIPARVTLLETLGIHKLDQLDVATRWEAAEPYRSLAVPLGVGAGGEALLLDLHERAHGPHGLVAGATGSGKSELLQTLVAALAASYHPHEVAFVMVDYKGGGMANAFEGLPHLVGTITNLDGGLARRALTALKAELKRRQRLLASADNHIDTYMRQRRQGRPLEPLPHLIIIVDEFAELKAEQPDFMRELVSAVRLGRSLGVHLILATQKPAGVVDEQIWSNTRFRLCLRVERPEDSQEVLRCPDAASLTGAGRTYFQVGNNERFELFQAGWGGAPYLPDQLQTMDAHVVAEVGLDGRRYVAEPVRPEAGAGAVSQLKSLLGHIRAAAEQEGVEALPGPWLPELPEAVPLGALLAEGTGWNGSAWLGTGAWLEPAIGLVDDPEMQRREPLRLPLGKEGHLAVYGAPGMGKTTLLQTLLCSLALGHSPADVHLYVVDGSGRSLAFFSDLPHVGEVIALDDAERFRRLLQFLLQELESRKERVGSAGWGTLAAYRQAGQASIPDIVLAMDNYPAIAGAYPDEEEQLSQLAREGGSFGIHLVITAGSPALVRFRMAGNITQAVALTLADRGDYATAAGRTGGLEPLPVPGRGLVKGTPPLEFQTALPAAGETEWERSTALRHLFAAMGRAWTGELPRRIAVLPEVVALCGLVPPHDEWEPVSGDMRAALGVEVDSLEPFAADLQEGPLFLIAGPPASGKTTLLRTWALALAERFGPDQFDLYLVDPNGGDLASLRRLPHVRRYAADATALDELARHLSAQMELRRQALEEARRDGADLVGEDEIAAAHPPQVLVMDSFDLFRTMASDEARETLERLVRRERGLGLYVLAAGSSGVFSQYSYEGLVKAMKELQTGVVLGSNSHDDLQLFNLRPLTGEPGRLLPPGMGYYTRRGRTRAIKAATPHAGDVQLTDWVERIGRRGALRV